MHSSLTLCLLLQLLQVVVDHMLVCWEFLCTCYGCQYALSRVGECVANETSSRRVCSNLAQP